MRSIKRIAFISVVLAMLLALMHYPVLSHSFAANVSEFSATNASIAQAFTSTRSAVESGANGSLLVSKLNTAVDLLQKAEYENTSNPAQASADLANATAISQQVVIQSQSAAQMGANAKAIQRVTSLGAASAIVALTVLIYIYGVSIYRRLWFYVYRDHIVRAENEYE